MTSPTPPAPAREVVERLTDHAAALLAWLVPSSPATVSQWGHDLRQAVTLIETLQAERDNAVKRGNMWWARAEAAEAERDAQGKEIEALRAAVDWVAYPFVDNNTPPDEVLKRVGFMMRDIVRFDARAKLSALGDQVDG